MTLGRIVTCVARGGAYARRRSIRRTLALLAIGGLSALAVVPAAQARFTTGFWADEYTSPDPGTRAEWLEKTVEARASLVRFDIHWRDVVRSVPADPANPADPAYDFSRIDAAVRDATARGLRIMVTIYDAPAFAEGPGRAQFAPEGSWKPDPGALAAFGAAVATRYSGNFAGLPHVRYYELWNEPNLPFYLSPQWEGKRPASPEHFRRMLNAFYASVTRVNPSAVVISGGLAPYGDPAGGDRTRPLRFIRELLCLTNRLKPARCEAKAQFDILAHHPINTSGGPRRSTFHPDDSSVPDFRFIRQTLRRAERQRTVGGPKRHQLWATELWWETNPPDPDALTGLRRHARWIELALYLLWKQGAKAVVNFPIRDYAYDPGNPVPLQSGVFFHDGRPKPAFTAVRFPFVTERIGARRVRAWGKAPAGGTLRIERRTGGRWRAVGRVNVRAGQVFSDKLSIAGKAKLRARVDGLKSLVWHQRG